MSASNFSRFCSRSRFTADPPIATNKKWAMRFNEAHALCAESGIWMAPWLAQNATTPQTVAQIIPQTPFQLRAKVGPAAGPGTVWQPQRRVPLQRGENTFRIHRRFRDRNHPQRRCRQLRLPGPPVGLMRPGNRLGAPLRQTDWPLGFLSLLNRDMPPAIALALSLLLGATLRGGDDAPVPQSTALRRTLRSRVPRLGRQTARSLPRSMSKT